MGQFSVFVDTDCERKKEEFQMFSRQDQQLDHFYFHVVNIQKYSDLALVAISLKI